MKMEAMGATKELRLENDLLKDLLRGSTGNSRVAVKFDDGQWYEGHVVRTFRDGKKEKHTVLYDDGDLQDEDFAADPSAVRWL